MGSKIIATLHPDTSGDEVLRLLLQLRTKDTMTQQVLLTAGDMDSSGVTGEYNRQWNRMVLAGKKLYAERRSAVCDYGRVCR